MDIRQITIFTILIWFFVLPVHVEAAEFAGPNTEIPKQPTVDTEKSQTISTQLNTTNSNQTKSITLANPDVEVTSDVYSEKDRRVLYSKRQFYCC